MHASLGRGALVRVLNLVTPASSRVLELESCASQKCYATTWIVIACLKVPHAINNEFKWVESMITHITHETIFFFIKFFFSNMHVKFVRIKMKQTIIFFFLERALFKTLKNSLIMPISCQRKIHQRPGKTNPNRNSQTAQSNVLSPCSKGRQANDKQCKAGGDAHPGAHVSITTHTSLIAPH